MSIACFSMAWWFNFADFFRFQIEKMIFCDLTFDRSEVTNWQDELEPQIRHVRRLTMDEATEEIAWGMPEKVRRFLGAWLLGMPQAPEQFIFRQFSGMPDFSGNGKHGQ